MLALPIAALLAFAPQATCADLPATATVADQFTCYKNAGRKVLVPGTNFVDGFDGPGCIARVWADRVQVTTCSPSSFDRRSVLVMFTSIRSLEDEGNIPYVILRLAGGSGEVDCAVVTCVQPAPIQRPTPAPAPAPAPRGVAAPRKP